jgi:O-antigen/teichoic acid export membrane protein
MLDKHLKSMVRGALFAFFGLVFSKGMNYLYKLQVARLGAETYGLLSIGLAIFGIASTLALLGMNFGVLRYVAYYREKKEGRKEKGTITAALKIVIPLSLAVALTMYLLSGIISRNLFHNEGLQPVIRIFSFMVPFFTATSVFLAVSRAYERMEYEVFIQNIGENVIRIGFTALFIAMGFFLNGILYAYLIGVICTFLLTAFFINRKVFTIFKKGEAEENLKELASYSWPLILDTFLYFIIAWTDLLMIGYFKGAYLAGIYNVALPTSMLLLVVPQALLSFFIAVLATLMVQKNYEKIRELYTTLSKWIFLVNFPIALVMMLFPQQIISIMFGKEYISGAQPLALLAAFYMVSMLFYPAIYTLRSLKNTKQILVVDFLVATTNIILNLIFIPSLGMIGGAISTGISVILQGILCFILSYRALKVQPFNRRYVKMVFVGFIPTALLYGLVKLVYVPHSIWMICIVFILFLAAYGCVLYLFRIFEKDDLAIIYAIKHRLTNIYK